MTSYTSVWIRPSLRFTSFSVCAQTFVLHRMVRGANATILLSCILSLGLSCLLAFVGCRGLPRCACYDDRTGLVRDSAALPQHHNHEALRFIQFGLCDRKCWFHSRTPGTLRWCARGKVSTPSPAEALAGGRPDGCVSSSRGPGRGRGAHRCRRTAGLLQELRAWWRTLITHEGHF